MILPLLLNLLLQTAPALGDFQLTTQDGRPITRADLLGHVTVIDFIFTRCSGPCPLMSSTLTSLQKDLPADVRFVSFTVDPAYDTPERLRDYAKLHSADLSRWTFVTGDKHTIYELARGLHVTATEQSESDFIHSSRYVLLDRKGRVRGMPLVILTDRTVGSEERAELIRQVKDLYWGAILGAPIRVLPAVNAGINGTCTLLLLLGLIFIKLKHKEAHRLCMTAAFALSILFLASYVTYHLHAGSTRFTGEGAMRTVYFSILISHIILAVAVPPLAIITLRRALKGRFEEHRRIARWTYPIWLYVSVTGVLVYFMLYHWFR